jgi:thiol-disulfide isomerase/thioredoxin
MIKKRLLLSLLTIVLFQNFFLSSCSKKQTSSQETSKPKVANSASIPTYVFYFASWCGFCHRMAPSVKKAALEFNKKVYFYYVDIDSEEGKTFSSKYRPDGNGVPYAQYYDKEGNFISDKIGLITYEDLKSSLEKLL